MVQVMAGAVGQHSITRASIDVDLSRHMTSLGHNEFIVGEISMNYGLDNYLTTERVLIGPTIL